MEKKYAEKCLASFLHTPADGGFFSGLDEATTNIYS